MQEVDSGSKQVNLDNNMEMILGLTFVSFLLYLLFWKRQRNTNKKIIIRHSDDFNEQYISEPVKMPPLRGLILRIASRLLNSYFGQLFLIGRITSEGGFDRFRSIKFEELPTFFPCVSFDGECAQTSGKNFSDQEIEKVLFQDAPYDGFNFRGMAEFISLYKKGTLTPSQVAERTLTAIKETSELKSIVKHKADEVREMAAASTRRYKSNSTLSPVDGIFVVVKDEFPVKGFPYSNGTSFLGKENVATKEAGLVEKLRELGVIVFAIANMHELGLGTSGNNSNKGFGTCRNPYHIHHYSGGSSSGCAAAVASGLCCMGLGTDGGGSIRIPASYCGVVGLKATFARFNLFNVRPLSNTVGHAGPICNNVRDATVFYALLAGPHPGYSLGLHQPRIKLPDFSGDLAGIKIGIDRRYFKDCCDDVYQTCLKSLDFVTDGGATIEDIKIPELEEVKLAHRIAIVSEMSAGMNYDFDVNFDSLTCASQIFFKVGSKLTVVDYLQANKQRTRLINYLQRLFKTIDVIVTPTAAHCAPPIVKSEISAGMLNGQQDAMNMRYAAMANLSGCPAVTVPVGYNDRGLPVGLQFMGAWWKEDLILKIAEQVERRVQLKKPKIFVDLIES